MSRFRTSVTLAVLVTLGASVPAAVQGRLALAPGDKAPRLTGTTPDREPWSADWGSSALTLVNFWATWCEPCKAEMPALSKLETLHAERGLRVVGVLMDPVGADQLAAFLKPLAVTYPIVHPSHHVNADWGGIVVMPITFLVDRQGRIVRRYVGATPEQIAGLESDVAAYLDGRPLGTMVMPATPSFVGDEERMRIQEENEKKKQQKAGGGS